MYITVLPWPLCAVFTKHFFTKIMPFNYRIRHDFYCYINERETPKTCLINHKGSISHHIMPLVINSLGTDTHTHTHTSIHHRQKQFGQHVPGLKTQDKIINFKMALMNHQIFTKLRSPPNSPNIKYVHNHWYHIVGVVRSYATITNRIIRL